MKESLVRLGLIGSSGNGWRLGMHVRWQWIVWVMLVLLVRPVAAVHPLEDRDSTDWIGPQPVDAKAAGIGRLVPDMSLEQVFGGPVSLHASAGSNGTVVVVRDPECPVSHAYGPRLARYARQYHAQGFNFLVLYMNDMIGPTAIAADASGFAGPAVFINGDTAEFAKQLGVQSTGDVFVLDADQRLVYRGAVDDQYGLGYTREVPTHRLLERALDALLQGRPVATPATTAPGCYIDTDPLSEPQLLPWSPEEQQS